MKKLFILVRNDLDLAYQGVQGGHAVAEFLIKNPTQTWNNETLVYLEADVERWMDKLDMHDINYTSFREPDLDNIVTAIGVHHEGKMFKNLKLMGHSSRSFKSVL